MINGTVETIVPEQNSQYFTVTVSGGKQYLSKKVIFAIGLKDELRSMPGLAAGMGQRYLLYVFKVSFRIEYDNDILRLPLV